MINTSQNSQNKEKKHSLFNAVIWLLPVMLCCTFEVCAAFDLDASIKSATDPVKTVINTYYPVGIFIIGAFGALLQQQGDLRDRAIGFGKGAVVGGLVVAAVKTYLGV